MSLSPRLRADYLLLGSPTPQRCLEAFATCEGAARYSRYPNIICKAASVFAGLQAMIDAALPSDLIAFQVGRFLDGGYAALEAPEVVSVDDLLAD